MAEATTLAAWLDAAREAGARTVALHNARARRDASALEEWTIDDASEDAIRDRAAADLEDRKLRAARYRIVASGDAMAPKTRVETFDDQLDDGAQPREGDAPWREAFGALKDVVRDVSRCNVELAKTSNQELRLALGEVSHRLVEHEQRVGEVLADAYEMASLKKEREDAERKSRERTETLNVMVANLAPIVGAVVSYASKSAMPALRSLLGSLTKEQIDILTKMLSAEQAAALAAILEAMDNEKGGRGASGVGEGRSRNGGDGRSDGGARGARDDPPGGGSAGSGGSSGTGPGAGGAAGESSAAPAG